MKLLSKVNFLISKFRNLSALIERIMLKILPSTPVFALPPCPQEHIEWGEDEHVGWECWAVASCGNNVCIHVVLRTYHYFDGSSCTTLYKICRADKPCRVLSQCL